MPGWRLAFPAARRAHPEPRAPHWPRDRRHIRCRGNLVHHQMRRPLTHLQARMPCLCQAPKASRRRRAQPRLPPCRRTVNPARRPHPEPRPCQERRPRQDKRPIRCPVNLPRQERRSRDKPVHQERLRSRDKRSTRCQANPVRRQTTQPQTRPPDLTRCPYLVRTASRPPQAQHQRPPCLVRVLPPRRHSPAHRGARHLARSTPCRRPAPSRIRRLRVLLRAQPCRRDRRLPPLRRPASHTRRFPGQCLMRRCHPPKGACRPRPLQRRHIRRQR